MTVILDILIAFLLVVGGTFGLVGSYGLVKLPDPMSRLHAPTKSATLGVGGVLFASLIWFASSSRQPSWHEFLIILLVFVTAPITGLMIAKANLHLSWRREDLPTATGGADWATYDAGLVPEALSDAGDEAPVSVE